MAFYLITLLIAFSSASFSSVKDHSKRFAFGVVIDAPGLEIKLKPHDEGIKRITTYKPNLKNALGLTGSAFGYSASYLFQLDDLQGDRYSKGESSFDDIRLSTFFGSRKQWRLGGFYTRYDGFFIENSQDVDNSLADSAPKIQLPDMKYRQYGGSILHIVDPKTFSYAAATTYSDQQGDSGGSWILGLDVDFSRVQSDAGIIPILVHSDYGSDATFKRGDFATISFHGGYGYSFVRSNWFLTPVFTVGLGYQRRKFEVSGVEKLVEAGTTKINALISAGYNGVDYFSGLQARFNTINYKTSTIRIESSLQLVRVTLGRRF